MEQSQLFDDNPFEALMEDFDGEQRSPEQPISLFSASQQPLTTSEVELEAIRAQQRALLQATSIYLFNNLDAASREPFRGEDFHGLVLDGQ